MTQREVSFGEAVNRALTVNYCNFQGRSSRSEYWWYCLCMAIFGFILGFICELIFSHTFANIITSLVSLALILPGLGLAVRRLHDIGKSGWLVLLALIPVVGAIVLIIWFCQPSQPTPNQYGPVPNVE